MKERVNFNYFFSGRQVINLICPHFGKKKSPSFQKGRAKKTAWFIRQRVLFKMKVGVIFGNCCHNVAASLEHTRK